MATIIRDEVPDLPGDNIVHVNCPTDDGVSALVDPGTVAWLEHVDEDVHILHAGERPEEQA